MSYEPDLLLVNANVLTMDPERPTASAVAVAGGRIVGVYDGKPDVTAKDVIDLRGLTLIPGFHDAHNHMIGFGLSLTEVDLRVDSLEELYARVAAKAAEHPRRGVDHRVRLRPDQDRRPPAPRRARRDRAQPPGLAQAHVQPHVRGEQPRAGRPGIGETAPRVDGGRVTTDAAGRPTGLLEERAQELVGDLTHPYPLSTLIDAVDAAGRQYLAEGITSVTEAGVGGGWIGQSPVELAAYVAAREQGRLHVRVELMVISDAFHALGAHPSDGIETGIDLGLRTGFGDDWLRLGPMKIFTDGSLVGRTAAMSAPFEGDPGNSGYLQADADHSPK